MPTVRIIAGCSLAQRIAIELIIRLAATVCRLSCGSPSNFTEAAWFTGAACAISQTAASMLLEHIEDRTFESVQAFSSQEMRAFFGAPSFLPPNLYPER